MTLRHDRPRRRTSTSSIADGVIADVAPSGELGDDAREIDRCDRPARPAGPDRCPRAPQRPRPRRLGGVRDRHARARGRRLHVRRRHAAELVPADRPRGRVRRRRWPRRRAPRTSTSRSGAASSRATSTHMDELAACGVVGFKAFMADSGNDDFAGLRRPHAVRGHAPRGQARPAGRRARRERRDGARARAGARSRPGARRWPTSSPRARSPPRSRRSRARSRSPREAGCALHIAHVSCGSAAALVAEARAAGADVTCETCPHYLTLTDEDAERIGAAGQVRAAAAQRGRARRPVARRAPRDDRPDRLRPLARPARAQAGPRVRAWGGISGCQTTARVLLAEGLDDDGARAPLRRRARGAPRPARRPRRARHGRQPARSSTRRPSRASRRATSTTATSRASSSAAAARPHRAHDPARPHGRDRRPPGRRAEASSAPSRGRPRARASDPTCG